MLRFFSRRNRRKPVDQKHSIDSLDTKHNIVCKVILLDGTDLTVGLPVRKFFRAFYCLS